jgi:small-conductance mechanosensitive channel
MLSYEGLVDLIWLESLQMRLEHWLLTKVLIWPTLFQLVAAAAGIGIAALVGRHIAAHLRRRITRARMTAKTQRLLFGIAISLVSPLIAVAILLLLRVVAASLGWPVILLSTVINLVLVWLVIRFASWIVRDETWSHLIALVAFTIATLDIVNLLQPTLAYLDSVGLQLGGADLTVLEMIKGASALAIFIWLAVVASRLLEQRVHRARSLTPSLKLLTGKLAKLVLIAVAVVIALNSVGVDLTAFAVFTGAVGVGVGFGLQKPIANLISGVILLLDRSIKPGDVIELTESDTGERTFGWVTALNARYASLKTRDGKEWLIPNEDLITQRVINWSFSNTHLRLRTTFGISYESDVRKAIRLAVEAAKENPRVLKDPAPVCRLMGFGDSSVNLELRIWIRDPANGLINVRSEILLAMWDKFHENGIRIPFAQRDLHIRGDSELTVVLDRHRQSTPA